MSARATIAGESRPAAGQNFRAEWVSSPTGASPHRRRVALWRALAFVEQRQRWSGGLELFEQNAARGCGKP
ncbi:MAG: hypothetical protein KDI71_18105, partial [Xanthomonadales bacterium]|nr:hypothetical protein [Xanthomonadales bacterium]